MEKLLIFWISESDTRFKDQFSVFEELPKF